ncbi:MAG: hypothetical protein ACR2NF_08330 [Pirellulales bacterium]
MLVFTNLPANEGDVGLKLFLYSPENGNLINASGTPLSELSNGVFMAEVYQPITTDLRADVETSIGDVLASDWLYKGNSVVGLKATEEEPKPV